MYDCLKIAPNNPLVLSNLGRFLFEKGNFDDAKIYLKKAIDLKPDFWIAYNNLATLEASEGNLIEAEKNFHKVIKINPNFTHLLMENGL